MMYLRALPLVLPLALLAPAAPVAFPVTGTAEGLVNGSRRSIPLTLTTTSRTGVYAVAKQWPNDGVWTLVVTVTQGRNDTVSAIVDLSATGDVMAMRVPLRERSGEHAGLPVAVSMAEVEASLRARAGGGARGR